MKESVKQVLDQNTVLLHDQYITRSATDAKVDAIIAFGDLVDRVVDSSANPEQKHWWGVRLQKMQRIFEVTDYLLLEVLELKSALSHYEHQNKIFLEKIKKYEKTFGE